MSNKLNKIDCIVNCTTLENAQEVFALVDKHGYAWCTEETYSFNPRWVYYEGNTCYDFKEGLYGDVEWYTTAGRIIITGEEFLAANNLISTGNYKFELGDLITLISNPYETLAIVTNPEVIKFEATVIRCSMASKILGPGYHGAFIADEWEKVEDMEISLKIKQNE